MRSNACFLYKIIFFLVFSALMPAACLASIRSRESSVWPKPPCKMYYPLDPAYEPKCPDITSHVCGSNGITYQNECFFCMDHWEFGNNVGFVKYGKCRG